MLIGLNPLLSPDLLHALAAMGHGDEIVVVDANFPAAACARRLIALDGIAAPAILEAILSVMPLDHAVPHPARVMAVVGDPDAVPPVVAEFRVVIGRALGQDHGRIRWSVMPSTRRRSGPMRSSAAASAVSSATSS